MSNPSEHVSGLQDDPQRNALAGTPEERAAAITPAAPQRPPAKELAPIIQAMNAVMKDVERITKTGKNNFDGYAYASEADVTKAIRPAMVEHGLVLFPNVVRMDHEGYTTMKGKQGTRVFLTVEFTLAHVSGIVWPEPIRWVGCAEDTQDKAVAQAGTSAQKYCLLRLFVMETGEDADKGKPRDEHAEGLARQGGTPPSRGNTGETAKNPPRGGHQGGTPQQPPQSTPQASNAPQQAPPPPPPQQAQQGGSQGTRPPKEWCGNCKENTVIASNYGEPGSKWCPKCKAKYPAAAPQGPYRPTAMAQSLMNDLTALVKNSGSPAHEVLEDFKRDNQPVLAEFDSDDGLWFEDESKLMCETDDIPF